MCICVNSPGTQCITTHSFKNVDFSRNCISNNIDKYVIGCFASGQKVLCSLILSDLKILSPFFVPHFSLKLLKKFEWQESIRQKNFIWHFFGEESSLLLQLTVGDSKSLELKIDGLYQMYTTQWGQGRGELGLFQTSSETKVLHEKIYPSWPKNCCIPVIVAAG